MIATALRLQPFLVDSSVKAVFEAECAVGLAEYKLKLQRAMWQRGIGGHALAASPTVLTHLARTDLPAPPVERSSVLDEIQGAESRLVGVLDRLGLKARKDRAKADRPCPHYCPHCDGAVPARSRVAPIEALRADEATVEVLQPAPPQAPAAAPAPAASSGRGPAFPLPTVVVTNEELRSRSSWRPR